MKCFVVKVQEGNDRRSFVFQQRQTSKKKISKLSYFKKTFAAIFQVHEVHLNAPQSPSVCVKLTEAQIWSETARLQMTPKRGSIGFFT